MGILAETGAIRGGLRLAGWLAAALLGMALLPVSSIAAAPAEPDSLSWTKQDQKETSSPGGVVYRNNCAACHDQGASRAPQRVVIQEMTPEAIHLALTEGAMRVQGEALSAQQRVAVAEYLANRRLGESAASGLKLCEGRNARFDFNEPPTFSGWGVDPAGTHAIPAKVSGLNRKNIGRLKLKWAFGFPHAARMRSQPALAGGAIILGNQNGTVYALDRASGCVRWSFAARAEVRTGIVVAPWRAGDRKARPLAWFGDVLGNVYAVNALSGAQVWSVRSDTHAAALITGTPAHDRGVLYVPVSSNEEAFASSPGYPCCNFRGSVVALDAATGAEKWRTRLVGEPKLQGVNKQGTEQWGPSGVSVWNSPSIDVKRGQLTVATSDNFSRPASSMSDAVVALDLATGRIKWHYQALGEDAWNVDCYTQTAGNCPEDTGPDYDFGAGTILARGANGKEMLLAGQKSGWVYGLDPDSGKLVWKTRAGRGGTLGGVHFGMAAAGGRLFVPISDNHASDPDGFPDSPGMYGLDVATGAFIWKAPARDVCGGKPLCHPGYGGSPSVTGSLLLAGSDDGHLRIYDTASGKVLWDRDTAVEFATVNGVAARGGSISGGTGPIAYKGQLIAVSGYGFASKMAGNVLLVYEVE